MITGSIHNKRAGTAHNTDGSVMILKNIKKICAVTLIVIAACQLSVAADAVTARYGASAVEENQSYTLAQMLTYAIEDEYLANARYTIAIEKFGNERPFTRIVAAEKRHISLLKPLLTKNNVPIPKDIAAQYVVVPTSLLAAMKDGVEAETNNMRMYDIFLKQQLPEDVRFTFTLLRSAAENHLVAFQKNADRLERGVPGRNI